MKRFVDTNIFIRILTNDDPTKAQKCLLFFINLTKSDSLITSSMNIAEIIWLLGSFYGLSKQNIYHKMRELKKTAGLIIISSPNGKLLEQATSLSAKKNIDFIDCYNASLMKQEKIKEIITYDKDFEKFTWLKVIRP